MAAQGQDGAQHKTEPPTPKKLRDARRQGDVWHSQDFSATVVVIVFALASALGTPAALAWLAGRWSETLRLAVRPDTDPIARAGALLGELALWSIVVAVVVVIVAALASALQVGALMSVERIKPDLKRLDPVEGLKRMCSWRTVIEALRLGVKLAALTVVLWLLARHQLPLLAQAARVPLPEWLAVAGQQFQVLFALVCLIFGVVALADLAWQRWDWLRRLRMSKDEVRREYKEREGDPILRGRRKQLHHEIGFSDMLQRVRQASVVVVNPTHVAVALHYDPAETPLPVVVAKGEGEVARAIREAAEEAGVPVYRDVSLARALQAGTPLGDYIPDELMEAVAQVLRWVEQMRRQDDARGAGPDDPPGTPGLPGADFR